MQKPFYIYKYSDISMKTHNVVHHRADNITERITFSWHSSFHLKRSITQQQNMNSFSKERRIILALEAIKNNKNLSSSMAAQIYEIPQSTLYYRMNGRASRDDSRNGRQKLTKSEEDAIIQYVLDLDK